MLVSDDRGQFHKDLEARCNSCGKTVVLTFRYGNNLKPGDKLWNDPENPNFGRCPKCKRRSMTVVRVATATPVSTEQHPGFWKPPGGPGNSSSSSG